MKLKLIFTLIFCVWWNSCNCLNNTSSITSGKPISETEQQFVDWASRQFSKRMLWMTHKRRFVLPKGTILQITPKITVPVFRHAPYNGGFDSDIQASWTFYMKFDKLNMTSDDHPWPFDRPPFYPFGEMMRPNVEQSSKDKDKKPDKHESSQESQQSHLNRHPYYDPNPDKPFPNIKHHFEGDDAKSILHTVQAHNVYPAFGGRNHRRPRRPKRAIMSLPLPESMFGGERAVVLPSLERIMTSLGMSGRSCLLRAVCEVHEYPLSTGGYGLFGELVTLFFSVSESPYAESHLPAYLEAEGQGKSGDCAKYKKSCEKSIFVWERRPEFDNSSEKVDQIKVNEDNAL